MSVRFYCAWWNTYAYSLCTLYPSSCATDHMAATNVEVGGKSKSCIWFGWNSHWSTSDPGQLSVTGIKKVCLPCSRSVHFCDLQLTPELVFCLFSDQSRPSGDGRSSYSNRWPRRRRRSMKAKLSLYADCAGLSCHGNGNFAGITRTRIILLPSDNARCWHCPIPLDNKQKQTTNNDRSSHGYFKFSRMPIPSSHPDIPPPLL